uniref:Uncharacterized protein n=1 Tax=Saimiri boliviensis boliviensis TaxID=39432 RepID=A0A2K6TPC8_SAIBB
MRTGGYKINGAGITIARRQVRKLNVVGKFVRVPTGVSPEILQATTTLLPQPGCFPNDFPSHWSGLSIQAEGKETFSKGALRMAALKRCRQC